jgi:hypothetical protein
MQNPPAGFGALCAIHPDRTARVTCRRCGNFMCDECSLGGSETLCPRCQQLQGAGAFPFDRNNVTFGELLNHAMRLFGQEWVMLSVAVLVVLMIGFAASFVSNIFQGIGTALAGDSSTAKVVVTGVGALFGTALSVVVQGAVQLGLYRVCFDVLQGRKADVARLFTQISKLGRYIVQMLVVGLAFGLPMVIYFGLAFLVAAKAGGVPLNPSEWGHGDFGPPFFIVLSVATLVAIPVIVWFGLPISFASMELVYGDCGAVEALRRAFQIVKGFRLWLLGYAFLGGIAVVIGYLLCCLPGVAVTALLNLVMAGLYVAVRNGSGLPAPTEP